MNGFWYLATPYSKWKGGLDDAFQMACRASAQFMRAGIPIFCPIAHTHPIAVAGGIDPLDHSIWLPLDAPLMTAAHGLLIWAEDGWQMSYGIAQEQKAFHAMGKPSMHIVPGAPIDKSLANYLATL